jgi:hypothetical protein
LPTTGCQNTRIPQPTLHTSTPGSLGRSSPSMQFLEGEKKVGLIVRVPVSLSASHRRAFVIASSDSGRPDRTAVCRDPRLARAKRASTLTSCVHYLRVYSQNIITRTASLTTRRLSHATRFSRALHRRESPNAHTQPQHEHKRKTRRTNRMASACPGTCSRRRASRRRAWRCRWARSTHRSR